MPSSGIDRLGRVSITAGIIGLLAVGLFALGVRIPSLPSLNFPWYYYAVGLVIVVISWKRLLPNLPTKAAQLIVGAILLMLGAWLAVNVFDRIESPFNPQTIRPASPAPAQSSSLPPRLMHSGMFYVQVPATRMWTPTGLNVRSGARVFIRANGRVSTDDPNYLTGPEGFVYHDYQKYGSDIFLLGGREHFMGLIAKILNPKTGQESVFYAARACKVTAKIDGALYLGVNDAGWDRFGNPYNDNSPCWKDNKGAFEAEIEISQ